MTHHSAFKALLRRRQIPFEVEGLRVCVLDNLTLDSVGESPSKPLQLPDDLVVQGRLHLSGRPIRCLPTQLAVESDLRIHNTSITALPDRLSVGNDLVLHKSPVLRLPEGLKIPGSLDISGMQIAQLPESLVIGHILNLKNTPITAFPKDMQVGGMIVPPDHLHDVDRFSALFPHITFIPAITSGHERLVTRAYLQDFPDMCRVVMGMGRGRQLGIRNTAGTTTIRFEPVGHVSRA